MLDANGGGAAGGGVAPAFFRIFENFFAQNVFKCLKRAKGVKIFPYERLKKTKK